MARVNAGQAIGFGQRAWGWLKNTTMGGIGLIAGAFVANEATRAVTGESATEHVADYVQDAAQPLLDSAGEAQQNTKAHTTGQGLINWSNLVETVPYLGNSPFFQWIADLLRNWGQDYQNASSENRADNDPSNDSNDPDGVGTYVAQNPGTAATATVAGGALALMGGRSLYKRFSAAGQEGAQNADTGQPKRTGPYRDANGRLHHASGQFAPDPESKAGQRRAGLGQTADVAADAARPGLLSRIGQRLRGLGRFGKIATVATVGTGAAVGLTGGVSEANASEAPNVPGTDPTSTDRGFFQTAADGAHAFAHGFADEITNTGAWAAGSVVDAFDNASGWALSKIGIDTGYDTRDISADWQQSVDNLADNMLGAPDLSSGFAQAMHTTGGVASWFVGPAAVGFVKLGNVAARGASGLAQRFGASASGRVSNWTGVTARVGVPAFAVPSSNP